jgi:hypothetical protein
VPRTRRQWCQLGVRALLHKRLVGCVKRAAQLQRRAQVWFLLRKKSLLSRIIVRMVNWALLISALPRGRSARCKTDFDSDIPLAAPSLLFSPFDCVEILCFL